MTNAEIAAFAINGLTNDARMHLDIIHVMQGLRLNTEEAVECRRLLSAMRRETEIGGDRWDRLSLALTVTNQYARNYSLRSA